MRAREPKLPLWKRLALFAPALVPLAALAAGMLVAGYAMAREAEAYAAAVFLVLGGLLAWCVLAIGWYVVRDGAGIRDAEPGDAADGGGL